MKMKKRIVPTLWLLGAVIAIFNVWNYYQDERIGFVYVQILITVVFSVLGLALKNILGLDNFLTAFWFFLALGEGLGLFDLIVIDLLWWRNTKRIRFSFLPEKSHYQDPSKHIGSFLRGIPLFALVAVLSAEIVTMFG